MAEEAAKDDKPKTQAEAAPAGRKPKKKKSWPANCVQTNKRIRRKDWYFRNGKYFANKKSFNLYVTQEAEKVNKAKEAQAAAKATAPAPETTEAPGV